MLIICNALWLVTMFWLSIPTHIFKPKVILCSYLKMERFLVPNIFPVAYNCNIINIHVT